MVSANISIYAGAAAAEHVWMQTTTANISAALIRCSLTHVCPGCWISQSKSKELCKEAVNQIEQEILDEHLLLDSFQKNIMRLVQRTSMYKCDASKNHGYLESPDQNS